MSDPVSVDPKTQPVITGHNSWTHALLAGLKLDHLNVLALTVTLRPAEIATLTATIALDIEQDAALQQALIHKRFALLEVLEEPELVITEHDEDTPPPAPALTPVPSAAAVRPRKRRAARPTAA